MGDPCTNKFAHNIDFRKSETKEEKDIIKEKSHLKLTLT